MDGSNKLPPGIWAMNWPTNAPTRLNFPPPPRRTISFNNGQSLEVGRLALQAPLQPGERGAILAVPNPFEEDPDGGVTARPTSFDPDVVRGALLLFDRFEHPSNTMMQIGEEQPAGLEDFDRFQRSRLELSGHMNAEVWGLTNIEIFQALQERDGPFWAVARSDVQDCLPKEAISPQVGLQMKMLNALPLPDREVPYDEVLSFKQRHAGELSELRGYLDELALEVVRNGASRFAETVAFEKFERALSSYSESMRKTNFLKRMLSLDVSFSLSDAVAAGWASAATAGPVLAALGGSLGQIAGAAIGAGFSAGIGLKNRNQKDDCSPFEYVFKAGQVL